jgi:hypothetical protein
MTQQMTAATEKDIATDPKAFLARQGVEINEAMETKIKTALEARRAGGGQPAIIVHIDG